MTEMHNLVDRLQDVYHDRCIIKGWKHEGESNVFSEESKRKLIEMGNVELYELSENSQNNSVSYKLVTSQRRNNLLRMRSVFDTFAGTRR